MRPDSSAWRVSDAVAYDVALSAADDGLAGGSDTGEAVAHRASVLEADGFDRPAVDSIDPGPGARAETATAGAEA